jgi:hypothetical protein
MVCSPVMAKIVKLSVLDCSVIFVYPFISLDESSIVCIKEDMFIPNRSISFNAMNVAFGVKLSSKAIKPCGTLLAYTVSWKK